MPDNEPTDDKRDIQGGLFGFNKDFVTLVFLQFPTPEVAKATIAALLPQLTNGYEVLGFNTLYKEIRGVRKGERDIIQASWANLWLSKTGLTKLGASLDNFPAEFTQGMPARASVLGDVDRSAPEGWDAPFTQGAEPDAVLYLAADASDDLNRRHESLIAAVQTAVATILPGEQTGKTRDDPNRGHEHFGFRDGISQPSIQGFTTSSKKGPDALPAGDFLIGYPDSTGQVSGQPQPSTPPAPSPYNPQPTPPSPGPLPPWMHNASFVVYRKLQQDVGGLAASMQQAATTDLGLSEKQLAAKSVGRWPSGAPMEHVPGEPHDLDPSQADPSEADQDVLSDEKINNFDYDDDADGSKVPRAAHIRKVNPRTDALPDGDRSSLHRILRRGIPYGTDFTPGNPGYGTQVPPEDDRGLLFISYQASIERGFEFVQRNWVNRDDFPQAGDGLDPIAAQATDPRPFTAVPGKPPVEFARWVFTRAGAYFISPALSGLSALIGD